MTSLFHQFCCQGTKSQSTQLGQAKTQPRSIPFGTKLFTPHFAYFWETSPPILLKSHDFTFHQFCYQGIKTRQCDQTWLSQNPTKINFFCNQTFGTSFWMHLWQFPTKIAQKPWLHFFTNFGSKAQKANPPNLDEPKPNQDEFHLQPNFSHLILHTFGHLPTRIAQKPWLQFSPILLPRHKKPMHPTWLSPKPNQDQFLLQPNFWHLILDAFVTISHQDCPKTMTLLFHQFFYQGTKSQSDDFELLILRFLWWCWRKHSRI